MGLPPPPRRPARPPAGHVAAVRHPSGSSSAPCSRRKQHSPRPAAISLEQRRRAVRGRLFRAKGDHFDPYEARRMVEGAMSEQAKRRSASKERPSSSTKRPFVSKKGPSITKERPSVASKPSWASKNAPFARPIAPRI